jgi:hypothetical protein
MGVGNGIVIVVFTEIYKKACYFVVDMENHKFESRYESSFIFKKSFFDFVLSYINLAYYAFYMQDFHTLANNFITIIITKNLVFAAKVSSADQLAPLCNLPLEKISADEEVEGLPPDQETEIRKLSSSKTTTSTPSLCQH